MTAAACRSLEFRCRDVCAAAGDGRLWQIDGESRAFPQNAAHDDFAAGLPGEADRLAEAKAGAFSDPLGGVKRFEDGSELVGCNAGAGVLDRDGNEFSAASSTRGRRRDRIGLPDTDGNKALILHGVPAVHRKIDQGGLELGDVRQCETFGITNLQPDLNSSAEQRSDELGDSFDLTLVM